MRVALLPCVALAAMVVGCGGDDDSASPGASMRVGATAVDASITVPRSVPGASADADDVETGASTAASEHPPYPDTTMAPAYVDVEVGPGLGTDEFVGARDDVQLDRCELEGDHWVAAGLVTNTSGAGAGYRIYVAFNPPDSPEPRGLVQVDFIIPDGESQAWQAVAWITDLDLQCVLRVERVSG